MTKNFYKYLRFFLILLFIFFKPQFAQDSTTIKGLWIADNGDGTYKNPIIFADYSDPDVIRVGDDYFMVSSSFVHTPGLPLLGNCKSYRT
jgi:hypothetical protein